MTALRVPFHVAPIEQEDVDAVAAVLASGWLTTGPRCREFESRIAQQLGGGVHALAVSSCTAALHLALEAIGVGRDDLVLVPSYTFTATAEVVRYLGGHPVLVDVDPVTGNMTRQTLARSWAELGRRDRERVRAVVPVHFAGLPCALEGIVAFAHERGWAVVDDAAHALPAARRGAPVGTGADATAFSFYATKTLCTGEGGMVVTGRDDLAARMRVMRLHGIDRDVFDRYVVADTWRYEVIAPGFKYNLSDVAAALGLSQLRRLHEHRDRRAAIAAAYDDAVQHVDGLAPPAHAPDGDEHAWHLYALRVQEGSDVRDALVRELAQLGIATSVHFIPLHLHRYYRETYGWAPERFPGANALFEEEISLPLFPSMSDEQVAAVVDALPVALRLARRAARATRRETG